MNVEAESWKVCYMRERERVNELLAKLLELQKCGREAVAVYDRYCLHDMTVDEASIGAELEKLRKLVAP